MSVAFGLVVLGVLVFVHELGHFLAAKGFGVRVEKFSIGFGPALLARKVGDTVYAFSAVPLGGFVKMAGDQPEEGEHTGAPHEYLSKPWPQRLAIVVAGPLANLAFALLANCFVGVFGYQVSTQPNLVQTAGPKAAEVGFEAGDRIVEADGAPVENWHDFALALGRAAEGEPVRVAVDREGEGLELLIPGGESQAVFSDLEARAEPLVGDVAPGMPAYQAGLRPGDQVKAVDGTPVATWEEMRRVVNAHPEEEIQLDFERDGQRFSITLSPMASTDPSTGERIGVIGISLPTVTVPLSPWQSIEAGVAQTGGMVLVTYRGFWELVTQPRRAVRQVAGPITIAQIAGDSGLGAPGTLLTRAAFISVALMALNLLPIPVLDGGHALFCVIEGLRGRRVSLARQVAFQRVGLVILGSLIVFALVNDFLRVDERRRATGELRRQEAAEEPGPRSPAPAESPAPSTP